MVVSSEDVISVWPFWQNWQCSTVFVCPSSVARVFPDGTSNTWKEERNVSTTSANVQIHIQTKRVDNLDKGRVKYQMIKKVRVNAIHQHKSSSFILELEEQSSNHRSYQNT